MNDYQLQLECDLAIKRVMNRIDMFIIGEQKMWDMIHFWIPIGMYPIYTDDCIQPQLIVIGQKEKDAWQYNVDGELYNAYGVRGGFREAERLYNQWKDNE